MARINIEDSIWKDQRFIDLIIQMKNTDQALGSLVRAYILAQQWYFKNNRLIPLEEWKKQKLPDSLFTVGLATLVDDHWVKVSGSDDQFRWLLQKIEAGKKGGEAKAKHHNDKAQLSSARVCLADPSGSYPLPLSPSLVPDCDSNPSLDLKIEKRERKKSHSAPSAAESHSLFDFEAIYKEYPLKKGKSKGIKICQLKIKTTEDYKALQGAIRRYRADCVQTGTYIQHFNTFMNGTWEDWLDPETGTGPNNSGVTDWVKVLQEDNR